MFPGPLRAFHLAAQSGSIRKASEVLGVEPSSVSRQIATLEAMMGTKLFERSPGGVSLTHAGQLIAEFAQNTVREFDTLRVDLDDLKGSAGHIRVGMVESVVSAGPVAAAANFRERFPNVTFSFEVLPALAVLDSVAAKRIDIGISFSAPLRDGLTNEPVALEPLVLVLSPSHPLASAKSLSLPDLAMTDLALPDQLFQVRRIIDQIAQRMGLKLNTVCTSNSFEILRAFARSGVGVTILPSRAIGADAEFKSLVAIPLDHPELKVTTLDLVRLKGWTMPRVIRLYTEALRETLRDPGR